MSDVGREDSVLQRRESRPVPAWRHAATGLLAVLSAWLAATGPADAAERAAMVIDANTGAVLYNSSGDAPRYPASLTKMMTLYLTFDLIEKGRLKYSDTIAISAQAATQPPSKLDLDAGERISVRDAVRALVTKSANDIAVALAEHIGGTEANFARLMTNKAHAIGMQRTTFKNASGLPNDEQTTTARDMLTLALRLQDDFPEHYKVFSTRSFAFNGASHRNHNTLLYHYRGTDGIKTGYTRMSGFNLVTSVRRDGRHLVAAVFGGHTAGGRNAEMRTLLDRTFARASAQRTRPRSPQLIARPAPAKRPAVELASATREKPPAAAAPLARAVTPPAKPMPAKPVAEVGAPDAADITSKVAVARVRPISFGNLATQRDGAIEPPAATVGAPVGLGRASDTEASATGSGRPPSTLHEQLSNILSSNRRAPTAEPPGGAATTAIDQPTYRLRGPVAAPESEAVATPPAKGGAIGGTTNQVAGKGHDFLIQIGAYESPQEAQRRLQQARETAATVLRGTAPITEPVTKGDRQLYRARFAGFDSARATEACIELRRLSIDCMVAKAR